MTHGTSSQDFLTAFAAALMRWNRTMNLVSRDQSSRVVENLLNQCLDGGRALWERLDRECWLPSTPRGTLFYCDLGSGGGLPGLVWHHLFSRQFPHLETLLVEPREKRAWFLRRQSELAGSPAHAVLEAGWGEAPFAPGLRQEAGGDNDSLMIISLKALHLTDPQVLAGLAATWQGDLPGRLVVARYYPAGQRLDGELVRHLALPRPGQELAGWLAHSSEVLTWPTSKGQDAGLVLSFFCQI